MAGTGPLVAEAAAGGDALPAVSAGEEGEFEYAVGGAVEHFAVGLEGTELVQAPTARAANCRIPRAGSALPLGDGHGSWSPDGQSIVFTSARNRNHDVYPMDPDRSGRSPVDPTGSGSCSPPPRRGKTKSTSLTPTVPACAARRPEPKAPASRYRVSGLICRALWLTGISRGRARSVLGSITVRTPSSNVASIRSASTVLGRVNTRSKRP